MVSSKVTAPPPSRSAAPRPVPVPERSAEERLTRGGGLFVGTGGLFYAALTVQPALSQTHLAATWWTPTALAAIYLPPALMVLAAALWRLDLLRYAVLAFAGGYGVAIASWLLVRTGHTVGNETTLWIVWMPGLPAVAMCLFRHRTPFVYLAVVSVLSQLATMLVRTDYDGGLLLSDILFAVSYSALPAAACVGLIRTGRILDETSHAVTAAAADNAAAEARRFERRRFDGLTHDGVIATLLQASRAANTPLLAGYGRSTLESLDGLRSGAAPAEHVEIVRWLANLRAVVADIDDTVPVLVNESADRLGPMPGMVATLLVSATGEAVRNWQRHASTPVRAAVCEVTVTVERTAVTVEITDDGAGFDTTAVPSVRIGLRANIIEAFADLPGGWSSIDSLPGRGCRVCVGWTTT
ncbi:signal transduction histidine kinase [Nocardia bhagyanarayanae]|uniref:Signal transduction histidine kinase n=2 Tax=Nocardia bhagyanarayanae TaxID=1215925 RepID=A0A543FHX6_9NOCA|nr:signal transduction histidine kinase [Nocardia bhagyanarayanae]